MLMLQLQAPKAQSGFWLPVPGRVERSSQLCTADTKDSSSWRSGSSVQATFKAEGEYGDKHRRLDWHVQLAGLVWRWLRHPFLRVSSWDPWSPSLEHVRRTLPGH